MTKLVHWTLTSQSTKQVACFKLVMKRDHFNWSSSAEGKIAPAVLLMRQIDTMRQNRRCQIYWQILHPEKNVMRSTVLQVRGCKSPLLLGGETLGLRCSADMDRVMYNKRGRGADRSCWCGADSGHKFSVRAISTVHLCLGLLPSLERICTFLVSIENVGLEKVCLTQGCQFCRFSARTSGLHNPV